MQKHRRRNRQFCNIEIQHSVFTIASDFHIRSRYLEWKKMETVQSYSGDEINKEHVALMFNNNNNWMFNIFINNEFCLKIFIVLDIFR